MVEWLTESFRSWLFAPMGDWRAFAFAFIVLGVYIAFRAAGELSRNRRTSAGSPGRTHSGIPTSVACTKFWSRDRTSQTRQSANQRIGSLAAVGLILVFGLLGLRSCVDEPHDTSAANGGVPQEHEESELQCLELLNEAGVDGAPTFQLLPTLWAAFDAAVVAMDAEAAEMARRELAATMEIAQMEAQALFSPECRDRYPDDFDADMAKATWEAWDQKWIDSADYMEVLSSFRCMELLDGLGTESIPSASLVQARWAAFDAAYMFEDTEAAQEAWRELAATMKTARVEADVVFSPECRYVYPGDFDADKAHWEEWDRLWTNIVEFCREVLVQSDFEC